MSAAPDVLGNNAQEQLKSLVDRVLQLETEKSEIGEEIKGVYTEAKGNGFDVKTLRKVVRYARQDRAKAAEEQALLDLYLHAVLGI